MADQYDERFSSPQALRLARELSAKAAAKHHSQSSAGSTRKSISPSMLSKNMYTPENSEEYRGFMNNPEDYYDLASAAGQAALVLPPGAGSLFSGAANAMGRTASARAAAEAAAMRRAASVRSKSRPGDPDFIGPVEQIGPQQLPRPTDPKFIGPREQIGPQQPSARTIYDNPAGPTQPFRTNVRPKSRPGDPEFIGPVEQIGPQLPRPNDSKFIGPREQIGPRQPARPGEPNFIGPVEQIGPQQLPRPTDPRFIGPREQIGPNKPFVANGMSRPVAEGTMAAGALSLVPPAHAPSNTAPAGDQRVNRVDTSYSPDQENFQNWQRSQNLYAKQDNAETRMAHAKKEAAIQAARDLQQRKASAQQTGNQAGMLQRRPEQPGILSRIFSGQDYQSNSKPVVDQSRDRGQNINWGNSDNSADFFRADKALTAQKAENKDEGYASGGSAKPHKDAALHKALEIIHSLINRR